MLRVALTIPAEAAEEALDALVPLLPPRMGSGWQAVLLERR